MAATIQTNKQLAPEQRATALTGMIAATGANHLGIRPSNSPHPPRRIPRELYTNVGSAFDHGMVDAAQTWPTTQNWDLCGCNDIAADGSWTDPQTYASFHSYDMVSGGGPMPDGFNNGGGLV
jgi:hypothetical protein